MSESPWPALLGSSGTSVGSTVFFAGGFPYAEFKMFPTDVVAILDFSSEPIPSYYQAKLSSPRAKLNAHSHGCVALFAGKLMSL